MRYKWLEVGSSVAEILGFLLAGSLYLANHHEAALVVLLVALAGWCVWVTLSLLRLFRNVSALSRGQSIESTRPPSQLQDMHAGWSGANKHRNVYRFRISQSFIHVDLLCYLWTPDSSEGEIILQAKDGAKHVIGKWGKNLTSNAAFPAGLSHGHNGVSNTQEAIVREAKIEAVCFDITDHVRSEVDYVVIFQYQSGNDGTWIKGIEVILR